MMTAYSDLAGHTEMRCKKAVLVYEAPGSARRFVSLHDVEEGVIGPGRTLSPSTLYELANIGKDVEIRREVLDDRILFFDPTRLVFWLPAHRRPLFFQQKHEALTGREIPHPALVFVVTPGTLKVFALQDNERPTGQTPLFRAPYFNLNGQGLMCRGNADYPETMNPSEIPSWVDALFMTNFTHPNVNPIVNFKTKRESFRGYMAKIARAKNYPSDRLIEVTEKTDGGEVVPLTVGRVLNWES